MTVKSDNCGCGSSEQSKQQPTSVETPHIVDYKVTMLIAAGAAMAANCEPCLNKIVPDLKQAGVGHHDIRRAVEIGQFVKDKPATIMKEAADILTGSHLTEGTSSAECSAETMKPTVQ